MTKDLLLSMALAAIITYGLMKAVGWVSDAYSLMQRLSDDLDEYLRADGNRMKLLNEAITRLAEEAEASRLSVERIEAAVFDKQPEDAPLPIQNEYAALYMEFKAQGKTDDVAADLASQVLNARLEEELYNERS